MNSKRIRNATVIKTSHDTNMADASQGLLATWASFPRHGALIFVVWNLVSRVQSVLFHSSFRLGKFLKSTSTSPNFCLLNGRWNRWFIIPQWWTSRDTFGRSFHHLGSCISTLRVGQMPLHPMCALVLKLWNKWISATEPLVFFVFFKDVYNCCFFQKNSPQFQSGFRDPFRQVHRREDATVAFHGCGKDAWPPDVEGYWYRYWCSNHAQLPGMGARAPWWITVRNVGENACKLFKT